MTIETSRLPTHLALVARRLNVCSPDDLAARFLEASYFAEAFLKTLAVVRSLWIEIKAKRSHFQLSLVCLVIDPVLLAG